MTNKQNTLKKGTTLMKVDSILSGLREYKMLRRKMIKLQTFAGVTISSMTIFVVTLLKKKPDKIIVHVDSNDAPYLFHKCFKNVKELGISIQKMIPSTKILFSSPVLPAEKANSYIKNFISLLNSANRDCIHHENIDGWHLNEYGPHINRAGTISLESSFKMTKFLI